MMERRDPFLDFCRLTITIRYPSVAAAMIAARRMAREGLVEFDAASLKRINAGDQTATSTSNATK